MNTSRFVSNFFYQDFFDHHHHDVQACGSKTRKYLESITTDYGPLKTLTASGCAIIHLVDYVKKILNLGW